MPKARVISEHEVPLREYPNAIWCDAHGTHHDSKAWHGEYAAAGCFVSADECTPDDWRALFIIADDTEEF